MYRDTEFDDEPAWICFQCGELYGRRKCHEGTTWHHDVCDICGDYAPVTEPRDFGYLKKNWRELLKNQPG